MASGRSIRFKISALLVIPLVSLVALWGFAASTTTREALNLLKVETFWTGIVDHADFLVVNLQAERLASAELLAGTSTDAKKLAEARAKVDEVKQRLVRGATAEDTQASLDDAMKARLAEVLKVLDRLPEIRSKVDGRQLAPHTLISEYATIPDTIDRLYSAMTVSTDVELARQAQGLIMAAQVRELLSREHALIVAGNSAVDGDGWTMTEVHLLAGIDGARTYLFPKALANLDAEMRAPLESMAASGAYGSMERALQSYVGGQPVDLRQWRGAVEPVLEDFTQGLYRSGDVLLARMEPAGMAIIVRAAVAGALGLVAVILSVVVSVRVGRRISRELAALRGSAGELAEERLPCVVGKLRRGEPVDPAAEVPPIRVDAGATGEVADLAAAFDSVRATAVDAAVEQARLREGVAQALRNLARRSQSLVQRQLKLLDEMQRETEEPEALERLFRLDHLTTRMRRHAEGLVLLSGGTVGRRWRGVIGVEEVLSGAAAQVEEYTRVRVYPMPESGVGGEAVADLMHLFAELIENAAAFSAPGSEVSVRGDLVGRGFAVEIEDRGLGMTDEARDAVNRRLAGPPEFDPARTEQLGFAVVGMLAARHGVSVTLKPSPYGGTTVIVLVPAHLIQPMPAIRPPEPPELESVAASAAGREAPPEGGAPADVRLARSSGPGGLPRRVRTSKRAPEQAQDSGLPRRVRTSKRVPDQAPQVGPPAAGEQARERSPEETRALLSSLQSGWQRGRQDSDQDGGTPS
ncbi:nitrate- and nitrite sensing domain-containing protein [Nonomuraea sp. MCN248]|uniref:histidine kinase n=1 Tax=Nonomuraea corallina TaxID=2989783 RepID=A0ABT4S3T8_9ACTN|nr:nitrate- and nitrite sensing domain-containing protein [Nonomuraea corallina]MDA0631821.1 nitrate- and nitrite sensing domain-containing protein [Nonomuraea corallina]